MSVNYNTSVSLILLKEFNIFINIFLDKKISQLLLYKNNNYIIKTERDLLYKPLYNLSNTKLIKLKRYLDNTLTKS